MWQYKTIDILHNGPSELTYSQFLIRTEVGLTLANKKITHVLTERIGGINGAALTGDSAFQSWESVLKIKGMPSKSFYYRRRFLCHIRVATLGKVCKTVPSCWKCSAGWVVKWTALPSKTCVSAKESPCLQFVIGSGEVPGYCGHASVWPLAVTIYMI